DPETVEFLESGCGLIVATATADHEPVAGRAWGLTVTSAADGSIRLLLDADDTMTLANISAGREIAVTGGNVQTLYSAQLKGRLPDVQPATPADHERAARYRDDFITAVSETDGTAPEKLRRLVPAALVACTISVDTLYNQTPG